MLGWLYRFQGGNTTLRRKLASKGWKVVFREVELCFHEGGLVSDGKLVHGREAGGSGIGISGVIKAPGVSATLRMLRRLG